MSYVNPEVLSCNFVSDGAIFRNLSPMDVQIVNALSINSRLQFYSLAVANTQGPLTYNLTAHPNHINHCIAYGW